MSPSCLDGFEDSAIVPRSSRPDDLSEYYEIKSVDLCESSGVIVDSENALVEEKVCCECVCEGGVGTASHLADVDGNCAAPITNGWSPSMETGNDVVIGVLISCICESVGERSDEDLVTHMLASNLCTVLDGEYASHIIGIHPTSADTGDRLVEGELPEAFEGESDNGAEAEVDVEELVWSEGSHGDEEDGD